MKRFLAFGLVASALAFLPADAQAGRIRDRLRAAFGRPACTTCGPAPASTSASPTAIPAATPAVKLASGDCANGNCPSPTRARGIIRR